MIGTDPSPYPSHLAAPPAAAGNPVAVLDPAGHRSGADFRSQGGSPVEALRLSAPQAGAGQQRPASRGQYRSLVAALPGTRT